MHEKKKKKKKKSAITVSACDVSSISEYLLQRLVMMWLVLFIGVLRNIQFPLTTVKGKQCMLYNVLADDIFVLRNIRTVKRGYNSVETKQNIVYALMGTYERLWGICD